MEFIDNLPPGQRGRKGRLQAQAAEWLAEMVNHVDEWAVLEHPEKSLYGRSSSIRAALTKVAHAQGLNSDQIVVSVRRNPAPPGEDWLGDGTIYAQFASEPRTNGEEPVPAPQAVGSIN